MSIRLRLTLLYTAILALMLAVTGGALYGTQARSLRRAEMQLLAEAARRIASHVADNYPEEREFLPVPLPPPGEERRPQRFGMPATYAQLLDRSGVLLLRSENLGEAMLPLSATGLQAIQRGEPWAETAIIEGERLLIFSAPIISAGQVGGAVQVAHSLAAQDSYLSTLRNNLLLGSAVAIVVAFGSGWLLAGLALRPIHRITHTARTIGQDRDLSRRVEYHGPNDELGQLATTFNAMLAELETAHRQQQQFVADVSHELRTPLTTLHGNIELLRRQPPIREEDRAEVLADMTEESKRLIRLVNALLTLARADARQPLKREEVRVHPLLEEICRQARLLAPGRPIGLTGASGDSVIGDPDALRQVVLILVDNALKYTEGAIEISAERADGAGRAAAAGEHIAIRVRDRGPGIEPEVLPRLFERFYRGDSARDRPGFGLGLAIAKSLVEAQGGLIAVESDPERGSTVTVTLPRAEVRQS